MGKAKKRSFRIGISRQLTTLSRESAVEEVIRLLKTGEDKKEVYNLVTLFCMSAEELLEAGASYESVMSLSGIVKE